MQNIQFQRAKLTRLIQLQGEAFVFQRANTDDLGEPDGTDKVVAELRGIWHESSAYITKAVGDASTTRSKSSPQVLALYEDANGIQQGDFTIVSGRRYNVTGVQDPNKTGFALDISLEEVI